MAKLKRGAKAAAIRELLKANRKMPVSEVVSTLAAGGIKVSRPNVYMIRLKMQAKRRKARRQKFEAVAGSRVDAITLVRHVKEVAAEAGGLARLKELVAALE